MKKLFTLIVALVATISLWAGNTITYTATEKLSETTDEEDYGLYTDAFNVSITSHTFADGTGTITFNGDVTRIGEYAFYRCFDLTSITIPNSVTRIGYAAFSVCSGLTSITIPNSVTSIGEDAFSECSGLTSITIPNSVTSIGNYTFYCCSDLTSIIIGNSVTSIGVCAFYRCSSLTSITIPNSVTSIERSAFSGCSGLTSITCEAVTPPACGDDCFEDVDHTIPLYVPEESVEAYKTAAEWKDFTNIQAMQTDGITNVNANANVSKRIVNGQLLIQREGRIYNAQGALVNQ